MGNMDDGQVKADTRNQDKRDGGKVSRPLRDVRGSWNGDPCGLTPARNDMEYPDLRLQVLHGNVKYTYIVRRSIQHHTHTPWHREK